jgi:putative phosphoribosyl transferase
MRARACALCRCLLGSDYQGSEVVGGYTEFQNGQDISVKILAGEATLEADLNIPSKPNGVILFAHGSGSSRHSPRNRHVANILQDAQFATLLLDLLTLDEESLDFQTAELRFDIQLLAKRLLYASEWLEHQPQLASLRFGYFGASTGAAAALVAASQQSKGLAAVVSRGGRPDLAGPVLGSVQAPTLLIVGEQDHTVVELNRKAAAQLRCEKRLEIVPGATHLFEEPGALDEVARLAREWFELHLGYQQNEMQVA